MFRRRNPLCADPFGFHAADGRIVVGEHVDHIVPRAAGGTDEWSNLQSLCAKCHARKTALYDGGFGNARANRGEGGVNRCSLGLGRPGVRSTHIFEGFAIGG